MPSMRYTSINNFMTSYFVVGMINTLIGLASAKASMVWLLPLLGPFWAHSLPAALTLVCTAVTNKHFVIRSYTTKSRHIFLILTILLIVQNFLFISFVDHWNDPFLLFLILFLFSVAIQMAIMTLFSLIDGNLGYRIIKEKIVDIEMHTDLPILIDRKWIDEGFYPKDFSQMQLTTKVYLLLMRRGS